MESQKPITMGTVSAKISGMLSKAQQEIEELFLQLSLGKAEASDKFEEMKKDLFSRSHEWKSKWAEAKATGTDKAAVLKSKLEELQLQLALGKAETKELFQAQYDKILSALYELEQTLETSELAASVNDRFKTESEKFRLRMEVIRLHFELGKIRAKEEFQKRKSEFEKSLEELKEKVLSRLSEARGSEDHFKREMKEALSHLRKAFSGTSAK